MNYFSPKILEALEFAAVAHKNQFRKYPPDTPFIYHPSTVGMILSQAGFPETVVIAGVLHDIVEDTSYTLEDLKNKFGSEIANLVLDVTENKGLPWDERKSKYLEHLKIVSNEAKAISAADLLANLLEDLKGLQAGVNIYSYFSKTPKDYCIKVLAKDQKRIEAIRDTLKHPLVDELEQVHRQVADLSKKYL